MHDLLTQGNHARVNVSNTHRTPLLRTLLKSAWQDCVVTSISTVLKNFRKDLLLLLGDEKRFIFLMFFSAESPSNITAYNQSSTSIVVTWDSLRPDILEEHNITGYRVRYVKKSDDEEEGDHFLCTISNTTILKNLAVFTNYCIEVASFTHSRMGNHSQCLVATTDEEGKLIFITFYSD